MAIFLTGSTGYIGAHVASILLERHADRLNLLVRAKTEQEANERIWHAMQLHLDFPRVSRSARHAHFRFSRRPHGAAFWAEQDRLRAPDGDDRLD